MGERCAVAAGEILGLASLIHDGEQGEIEPIVVASAHCGQGIGQALVEHVIQEAKNLGVLCLSVKPVARNREAIAFFHIPLPRGRGSR